MSWSDCRAGMGATSTHRTCPLHTMTSLGSSIHEHFHAQEEVYEVIEGELEVTIDGTTQIASAGVVAIMPSHARHSVKALTDGRAIIVDYPVRLDFGAHR